MSSLDRVEKYMDWKEKEEVKKKEEEERRRRKDLDEKEKNKKYLCIDPSGFPSYDLLSDLLKVLEDMKEVHKSALIVSISRSLYEGLENLQKKHEVSQELVDIYQLWMPFYTKESIEEILQTLSYDSEYRALFEKLQEFNPVYAEEDRLKHQEVRPRVYFGDNSHREIWKNTGRTYFRNVTNLCSQESKNNLFF